MLVKARFENFFYFEHNDYIHLARLFIGLYNVAQLNYRLLLK